MLRENGLIYICRTVTLGLFLFGSGGSLLAQEPPEATASLPPGQASSTVPFAPAPSGDDRVYVQVKINGRGPYVLEVDSGTNGCVIRREVAKELGLPVAGNSDVGTPSGARLAGTLVSAKTLDVGDAHIENLLFLAVDLPKEYSNVQGFIGGPFLELFVTTVDYVRRKVTFTRPDRFEYKGNGDVLRLILHEDLVPLVWCDLDGVAGRFMIDTGSDGGISLSGSFVNQNHLREKYPMHVTAPSTVGPAAIFTCARTDVLTLGGKAKVEGLVADMGANDFRKFDGMIGFQTLRQFTLTLDYPHETIILEKNRLYGERQVFNVTGWTIAQKNDGYSIAVVYQNSPASEAGLKEGDVLVQIGGLAAKGLPVLRLSEMAHGKPGTKLPMTVLRDGNEISVVLTLRDIL